VFKSSVLEYLSLYCELVLNSVIQPQLVLGLNVNALATGWSVRGLNPGGGEFFRTCSDRSWGPPSLLYNGYQVFPRGKERPGRDVDPSPLLVPWSRKGKAIPLLPLWAVRPVQSLSACIMVHFTLQAYLHSPICLASTRETLPFSLTFCYDKTLACTRLCINGHK
jgi:hypothetical protein